jgi:isoaspartyl peptidase/L-asparaginase-like protein (Ntn-hydrolase superfamily)
MTKFLATWEKPGEKAIQIAAESHKAGRPLARCLEDGLTAAEDDPEFVAIGRGSLPNSEGVIELDASIMDGRDLNCGAVCAMQDILPAIKVARLVMENTPHNLIAGDQARRFAIQHGIQPQDLSTPRSREHYQMYLDSPERAKEYIHTLDDNPPDTVTMLGIEDGPHLIAASSTSGLGYKLPGRVGDSPIVGAGIYADDEAGAAGATGWGEDLWKACVSVRVVDQMRAGKNAQEACDTVIREMVRRRPDTAGRHSVVIALDRDGGHGVAVVGKKFDLWVYEDGATRMETYEPN